MKNQNSNTMENKKGFYNQDPETAKKIAAILEANPDLYAEDFMMYGHNNYEILVPQYYTDGVHKHYGYESFEEMSDTVMDNNAYYAIDEIMHSSNF